MAPVVTTFVTGELWTVSRHTHFLFSIFLFCLLLIFPMPLREMDPQPPVAHEDRGL